MSLNTRNSSASIFNAQSAILTDLLEWMEGDSNINKKKYRDRLRSPTQSSGTERIYRKTLYCNIAGFRNAKRNFQMKSDSQQPTPTQKSPGPFPMECFASEERL